MKFYIGVDGGGTKTAFALFDENKNMLNENGMVLTNIISSVDGEKSDFIKYEYATYKAVFDDVKIYCANTSL